jgi:hypothetical protein
LLRIARGPIEKVRPHERQRYSGTSSNFFLRVPFLMRRLLLQCGQRPGGLSFESPGSARGTEFRGRRIATLVRRGICRKVYHRASNMQKTVRRAPILWATDLQTGTGVKRVAGRRQICKEVRVLLRGVERSELFWLLTPVVVAGVGRIAGVSFPSEICSEACPHTYGTGGPTSRW